MTPRKQRSKPRALRGRKPREADSTSKTPQSFRFANELPAEIDAFARSFSELDPTGREWNRTSVVEAALARAFRQWRKGVLPWDPEPAAADRAA